MNNKKEVLTYLYFLLIFTVVASVFGWYAVRVERLEDEIKVYRERTEQPSRGVRPDMRYVGNFKATAYTAGYESTGKSPGDPAYGITASGYTLTEKDAWRVIAADPKVLPQGSRVYIKDVGFAVVKDTGGAVTDNHIDVFVGMSDVDTAYAWGVQQAEIYLVR